MSWAWDQEEEDVWERKQEKSPWVKVLENMALRAAQLALRAALMEQSK